MHVAQDLRAQWTVCLVPHPNALHEALVHHADEGDSLRSQVPDRLEVPGFDLGGGEGAGEAARGELSHGTS